MNNQSGQNSSPKLPLQQILLFGLLIALPGFLGALFGLIYLIIPIFVLVYLYKWEHGFRYVLAGLVIGSALSLFNGSIGSILFTASFIAPGYSLALSAFRGDAPSISGLKGASSLCLCWIALLICYSLISGSSPVAGYIEAMDSLIGQELQYHQSSGTIEPETLQILEESVTQMKLIVPKIFPALLGVFALFTVWVSMIVGNKAVTRFTGYHPWVDYKIWQLPSKLIWVFIISVLLAFLPADIPRIVGINIIVIVSFIYIFQGFSILSFFLHKWNFPIFLRTIFYAMMLFQSFGTLLLLIIGVADIWFDLRRLKTGTASST